MANNDEPADYCRGGEARRWIAGWPPSAAARAESEASFRWKRPDTLDKTFAGCAKDDACQASYPNLAARVRVPLP
jgi:hypothetical protein